MQRSSSASNSAIGFSPGLANPQVAPGTMPPPPPPSSWTVDDLRVWGGAHRANATAAHEAALQRGEKPSMELVSINVADRWLHLSAVDPTAAARFAAWWEQERAAA